MQALERGRMIRRGFAILLIPVAPLLADTPEFARSIERWGIQEVSIRSARQYTNPFAEPAFTCRFSSGARTVAASGFYDGNHTWKCRLMPQVEGQWTFTTSSSDSELNAKTGLFEVTRPGPGNHGPVVVRDTYHFAYADGTS